MERKNFGPISELAKLSEERKKYG